MNLSNHSQMETIIDVRLRELKQLFNSLDATPFPETDLDADAEDFLISWALESSRSLPIRIRLHVQHDPEGDIEQVTKQTETALRNYFEYKADVTRRRLHRLLAQGRTRLLIGSSILILSLLAANFVDQIDQKRDGPFWNILHESLLIGGWVSMWGPLEILLYGWWPIRHERLVCLHLSHATLEIVPFTSRNLPA